MTAKEYYETKNTLEEQRIRLSSKLNRLAEDFAKEHFKVGSIIEVDLHGGGSCFKCVLLEVNIFEREVKVTVIQKDKYYLCANNDIFVGETYEAPWFRVSKDSIGDSLIHYYLESQS